MNHSPLPEVLKYFGTDGIRGRTGCYPITPAFMKKLGWVLGNVPVCHTPCPRVLLGTDTRASGKLLQIALIEGLSLSNSKIYTAAYPLPTPAISYLTRILNMNWGIVISASHNPYYDNGIKIFSQNGTKLSLTTEKLIELELEKASPIATSNSPTTMEIKDALTQYRLFCLSSVPPHFTLKGTKIVLDCANGSTYQIAPKIFSELGATVITLNVSPNGTNINENCGSTHPALLQKHVLTTKADLGIVFDGDGDRVLMVDHTGRLVDGDELLFILAKDAQASGSKQTGIVGTVMSNQGLEIALNKLGLEFKRTSVGDRLIYDLLKETGWRLGGESSGHILCTNITNTGDGIITALQILAALDQQKSNLHSFKSDFEKWPQTVINIYAKNPKDILASPSLKTAIRQVEKALAGSGRILLRPSGTEPIIRIMVEGINPSQVNTLAKQLADTVSTAAENANKRHIHNSLGKDQNYS